MSLPPDIELARKAKLKHIIEIADQLDLPEDVLERYGPQKAKLKLEHLGPLKDRKKGKYIAVTAITPTPLGEGKTVNTIGLAQGLSAIGEKAVCCIRQPSLGPVFGIKGGAAGGGYAQVLPMEDINLHLTGDFHAVSAAHNLLAAIVDNHLHHGNKLGIEASAVTWRRVVDMNDRALRNFTLNPESPIEHETGFDITAASEVMAILALATSYRDLRERLGRIIIGRTSDGRPITADALKTAGAMAILLKDALKPNLLQTMANTPAIIHAGPFANIAHGNSSVIADQFAIRLADYVVTESGFGADLGYEKFCDIKCRVSGLEPDCAVIVATVRALKLHSGRYSVVSGRPMPEEMKKEDVDAVNQGVANLNHHVEHVKRSGVPAVVAVNRFPTDTDREIEAVIAAAKKAGADGVAVSEAHARGADGARDLAEVVREACNTESKFKPYYELDQPIRKKITVISRDVYGADGVDFTERAEEKLERFERWGLGKLPICMAKTQLSISHDPRLKGRPRGFRIPVRNIRASAGAGFLYPLCGALMTMPGLPSRPGSENMDIDDQGNIIGLA